MGSVQLSIRYEEMMFHDVLQTANCGAANPIDSCQSKLLGKVKASLP